MPRDGAAPVKTGAAGIGTWAVINLPFVLIDRTGWWSHGMRSIGLRTADFNSIWIWGLRSGESLRSALSDAGLDRIRRSPVEPDHGGLGSLPLRSSWPSGWDGGGHKARGKYPMIQVCAALLAAFMLWNKVHSRPYALWLLPFFVLVGVHWLWWVAYSIVDLAVYVGIFGGSTTSHFVVTPPP